VISAHPARGLPGVGHSSYPPPLLSWDCRVAGNPDAWASGIGGGGEL